MVEVELTASARLRAQANSPDYTTTAEDLPTGKVQMAVYPRAGDEIEYHSGRHFTVQRITWLGSMERDDMLIRCLATLD